jgi:hypothetical protein
MCAYAEREHRDCVWDSDEHGRQLDHLRAMTVDARGEAEAVGAASTPIVNYPVGWTI